MDGRLFPWGKEYAGPTRANFGRTGLTGPVRDRPERLLLYPPIISVDKYENAVSPYELYQTIGNVAEWVADWYDQDYYKTAPDRPIRSGDRDTESLPWWRLDGQHHDDAGRHAERDRPEYEDQLDRVPLRAVIRPSIVITHW